MRDLIQEILASMRTNRMRTLLTGFAISWGIFILVVLLACGNGLNNGMMENFSSMSKNTVSLYPGVTSMPHKGLQKGRIIRFTVSDVEFLRSNLEKCSDFAPVYNLWNGTVECADIQINAVVTGVNPDYGLLRTFRIEAGRFINDIDMAQHRKVAVIPPDVSAKFFASPADAVGKWVKLSNGVLFQIVGVYKDKGRSWRPTVYVPLATANLIYNPSGDVHEVSYVLSGVETTDEAEAYNERLRHMLAQRFNFDPADRNAVYVSNRIESYNQVQTIFSGLSLFIWVIGLGTLVAGIAGVCNIMIVSVRERTREFGIRKALGATPASIMRMIVLEALTITSVFGYIGMICGIGVSELLCLIFPANPDTGGQMMPTMFVEPRVDLAIIVSATAVLISAGVIAGAVPARRAVAIKPIEAMSAK